MKKIFALAALALCLAACNKQEVQPVENDGMITLRATIAPKGAATKAITDAGTTIKADWVMGETLAILYEVDGVKKNAPATVTDVNTGTGEATIEFAVEAGTKDGTACTVIYPAAAAKGDNSGVKDDAELLNDIQDGTLKNELDVRVTTGVITPVTPEAGLDLNAPLAPKYAIFKLNLENTDSSPVTAKSLYVTIGSDVFVIKPTTPASELYVALPPVSGQKVIFTAMGETNRCFSKSGITIVAGKYYRSTLTMAAQSDSPDYVAMGDGLVWSTKNIGADSPEEPGAFYAWGEKTTKANFSWATYTTHGNGNSTGKMIKKYCPSGYDSYWAGSEGPDNILQLQDMDDVATQELGAGWHIPTFAEWDAIRMGGSPDFVWIWVTNYNGSSQNGRLLITKKAGYEGHCLFFPAAGYMNGTTLSNPNARGLYWTSTLRSIDPKLASAFDITASVAGYNYFERRFGFLVRGVKAE